MYTYLLSFEDSQALQDKLADKFKSGMYILDEGDIWRYSIFYLGAIVFFTFNTSFWSKFFQFVQLKQFIQRNEEDRVNFIMQVAGIVHHIIVASFSFYLMYNSCQNDLGNGFPSENGGSYTASGNHFGWWRSDTCMMEANKGYVYNLLISIAYMTVDLVILKTQFGNHSKLHGQTIWHHYMAISGFGIGMIAGYGMPGTSNCALFGEISSIFLCLKDMFTKDTRNSFWGIVVQVSFFITFTVFRFIMYPIMGYRALLTGIFAFELVGWFRKACLIFTVIQAQFVVLLNLYWYLLILKGLKRLLENLGVLQKPTNSNQYDDIDKYEACATTELEAKEDA